MSLTRNRRHRANPSRRSVAECSKVGNNRPKSRGRDRRPRGECSGLAAAPAPVPAVTSHGNGKMARQHSALWIAGQSERTTGNRWDITGRLPAPRTARRGDPGTVGADVLLAMAGMGARQGTEPPGTVGFLRRFLARTIISNPSEARWLQSAGGSSSTRGRVLILPLCFWRIIRFGGRES